VRVHAGRRCASWVFDHRRGSISDMVQGLVVVSSVCLVVMALGGEGFGLLWGLGVMGHGVAVHLEALLLVHWVAPVGGGGTHGCQGVGVGPRWGWPHEVS
jgi:hypothetical protein